MRGPTHIKEAEEKYYRCQLCPPRTHPGHPQDSLRGHILRSERISGDFHWKTHITKITNKANSTLAVLKRNVRVSSKPLKETAYKTLVRPQLEYSSPLWDPHHANLKKKVEDVQRRSARWVFNKYHYGPKYPNAMTPTEMIRQLEWTSMETRRRWAKLVLIYKMLNNLVIMSYRTLLVPYPYITQDMPKGAITPSPFPPPLCIIICPFSPVLLMNGTAC